MVAVSFQDGNSVVPDALVRAVVELADRQAEMTAKWLKAGSHHPNQPLNYPAAFLLELAALLQLGEWERQNVLEHLKVSLPSYRQAADELAARAKLGPEEFRGPQAIRLSLQVNSVWIERFVWDAPSLLQADIVFGDCNEDALVEQLADFLWQHHAELLNLSAGESSDETQ